jgi:hypothetical protein
VEVEGTLWLGGSLGFKLRVAKSHTAVMWLWADTGEAFVPEEESEPCLVFWLYSGVYLTTVEESWQTPSQGGWKCLAEQRWARYVVLLCHHFADWLEWHADLTSPIACASGDLDHAASGLHRTFISTAITGLPALWLARQMTSQQWGEQLPVYLRSALTVIAIQSHRRGPLGVGGMFP